MGSVRVKLVRKLAQVIDGVDLSGRSVGETFQVAPQDARLLMAERWAIPAEQRSRSTASPPNIAVPDPGRSSKPSRYLFREPLRYKLRLEN
jgi:hypothetical protein